MLSFNEALADEEARVSAIYPLGALGSADYPPEWLREVVSALEVEPHHALLDALPEWKKLHSEGIYLADDWAHAAQDAGRQGFIVEFDVCIRDYRSEHAFYSGWGMFRSYLLYVEDLDTLGQHVLLIARQQHEAECAKRFAKLEKAGAQ